MRVLYITHCTDMSGANKSMIQMITELRDNYGVDPFVVYPKIYNTSVRNIDEVMEQRSIPGLSHRLTCFQRSKSGLIIILYYLFANLWNTIHLFYLFRNEHFDLVHSNSSIIDTGLYLAKLLNIPHVWHFREVASLSFGAKSVLGCGYQKWVYHKTDRIIAISNNVKAEFKGLVPEDRTVIIPNGILPPVIGRYPDHKSKLINICIVGRVEPNKNQLEAVKAINELVSDGIHNIKLFIIGIKSSQYATLVSQYIQDNNLSEYVEMTGARTDINELLCDMNIGLMLSKHEAFGRVTVEYMMHGLCVIASNTSANPEIINDGCNGLLYEIGNPKDLASKIEEMLADRKSMQMFSQRGLKDALDNYRSETNSRRVFNLYNSIER